MYLPQLIIDQAQQDDTAKARRRQLETEKHSLRCHDKTSAVLHGFSPDAKKWRLWWECSWCGGKSEPFTLTP